jgi:L-alanine-DL-glutamate epimerase-like enolase superfamily enzyme
VNIKLHPYQLGFVFPFRIAHGVRTHTDALFVELEQDGITAFGEATFPPYLPYTRQDAIDILSGLDLARLTPKSPKGDFNSRCGVVLKSPLGDLGVK